MFTTICTSIGVEVEVPSAFRLGNRWTNRTGPLKVIMNNHRQRKDITDNAKYIGAKGPLPFKKVVIVKYLTSRQREENKMRRMNRNQGNQTSKTGVTSSVRTIQNVQARNSPMDPSDQSPFRYI